MSILGAMFTAVSGVNAQSRSLGHISDNIANSQTTGYKRVETRFETLITVSNANLHAPGGVIASPFYANNVQGNITQTQNTTNLAITGNAGMSAIVTGSNVVGNTFQILADVAGTPFTANVAGNGSGQLDTITIPGALGAGEDMT